MAEAVVSIALETIRDLLLEEGRFLAGVADQVKELERQLKEMKCFLEDADKRRHESRTISNWISEIRDLVYRSESAIERHAAYQVYSRRRGLKQFVRKYSCILTDCYSLHQLGSEISQITSNLKRITKDMQKNGIKMTCPNLHILWISSKLGKLGKVLAECGSDLMSSKLRFLDLFGSEIEDDPMGILGKLPCLICLRLYWESFVGEEMTCPANSFLCLERLKLKSLPKLREWRVEAGAMPFLSKLTIGDCSCLEMLPEGLSGISTLQTLVIKQMPKLRERVSPSGQDFHKVSHVPSIRIKD